MNKHSPFPWTHKMGYGKTSAVVDAEGKVVCGSLICEQQPQHIEDHRLITAMATAAYKRDVDPEIEALIKEDLRTHTDPDLDDKVLTLQSELDVQIGMKQDERLWFRMVAEKLGVEYEPHQTWHERVLEKADSVMHRLAASRGWV